MRKVASSMRPNSLRPSHVPAIRQGKPSSEQLGCLHRDSAPGAEPQRAHQEDRDRDRLEHRALGFLGPAAQAGPDRHQDSGEPGKTCEYAVSEADRSVGCRASRGDRLQRRAEIRIETVQHEKDAHRDTNAAWVGPCQERNAGRHAKCRAQPRTARASASRGRGAISRPNNPAPVRPRSLRRCRVALGDGSGRSAAAMPLPRPQAKPSGATGDQAAASPSFADEVVNPGRQAA